MNKIAKLVEVSFLVRIIVDENSSESVILEKTKDKIQALLDNNDVGENLVSIEDDEEVPYGDAPTDDDYITQKMINNARHYLSSDTEEGLIVMIKAILDYEDNSQYIDYIHGVVVWEKVGLTFTCSEFIEAMNF